MAFQTTNRAEFQDDNGIFYQIDIGFDNYSGPIRTFTLGEDGFKLSWKGRGNEIDYPIHSSEVTCTFYLQQASDVTRVLDILGKPEGYYLMRIFRSQTGVGAYSRFWQGVCVMNNTTLEDQAFPQKFTLRATDGLTALKGIKYDELEDLYNEATGVVDSTVKTVNAVTNEIEKARYSLKNITSAILRQLPTISLFSDSTTGFISKQRWGWYTTGTNISWIDAHNNPCEVMLVESAAFFTQNTQGVKYMNCYDILHKILHYMNARIHMEDGHFYINQLCIYNEWVDSNNTYETLYGASGTAIAGGSVAGKSVPLSSQFNQRSQALFNFKRIIKNLTYNINGVNAGSPLSLSPLLGIGAIVEDGQFNPGQDASVAYAIYNDVALDSVTAVEHETNLYVQAGNATTFTMQWSERHIPQAPPAPVGAWVGGAGDSYYLEVDMRVWIDVPGGTDYYLKFNPNTARFEWVDSEGPIFYNYDYEVMQYFGTSYYNTVYAGSSSTEIMDPCPVSGMLKWEARNKVSLMSAEYNGLVVQPQAAASTGVDAQLQSNVGIQGNYGPPENFPTCSIQLFNAGIAPVAQEYEYTNSISGTAINFGDEIVDSVFFIEQNAMTGSAANNMIYIKKSLTFEQNNYNVNFAATWFYYYEGSGALPLVHLPSLKASTLLALSSKYRITMEAKVLRKSIAPVSPTPVPWKFDYLLIDTVEGVTQNMLCLGGNYVARPAEFNASWYFFDFAAATNTGNTLLVTTQTGFGPGVHFHDPVKGGKGKTKRHVKG